MIAVIRIASSYSICAYRDTSHRFQTATRYAATRPLRSLAVSRTTDVLAGGTIAYTIVE